MESLVKGAPSFNTYSTKHTKDDFNLIFDKTIFLEFLLLTFFDNFLTIFLNLSLEHEEIPLVTSIRFIQTTGLYRGFGGNLSLKTTLYYSVQTATKLTSLVKQLTVS